MKMTPEKRQEIRRWALKKAEQNINARGHFRDTSSYDTMREYDALVSNEFIRLQKKVYEKLERERNIETGIGKSKPPEVKEWQQIYD